MSRRRTRKSKTRGGRILEGIVNGVLILVVIVFGVSIAARYGTDEGKETRVERQDQGGAAGEERRVDRTSGSAATPGGETAPEDGAGWSGGRSTPRSTGSRADDADFLRGRPTVDIRNGCGKAGLAEEMMNRLRRAGFDVVEYKNADRYDYRETLVRDRSGRPGAAASLQRWLREECGVGVVVDDRAAVPEADLVLVLGQDLVDSLAVRRARAARSTR